MSPFCMLQPNIVIMTNLKSFITSKQMCCKRIMSRQFRESIKSDLQMQMSDTGKASMLKVYS